MFSTWIHAEHRGDLCTQNTAQNLGGKGAKPAEPGDPGWANVTDL